MRLQTLTEARWILAFFGLLAVVAAFFSAWLSLIFLLLIFFTIAFFRDPERTVPRDSNLIVAAADGRVMDIVEWDENNVLKTKTRRVGIFLSILDVHTNRAPIDGQGHLPTAPRRALSRCAPSGLFREERIDDMGF